MKLWGLAFQIEFGNFEEKPGFIYRQILQYFQPYFQKYYNNDKFVKDVSEYYQQLTGQSKEEAMNSFFEIAGDAKMELNHFYRVTFRNSNNPNYRDIQPNVILGVNKNSLTIQEESSRETLLQIQLDEIMNWGINKEILVVCHGDRFEMTKIYFQCYNPYEVADILFNYCNMKVLSNDTLKKKHENLDQFILNSKSRKVNIFNYK